MPKFALAYPYFIIMLCLVVAVVGVATMARMPVDLFPQINIPVVVVATFYSGMPPQQIEADITNTFERFFTLGSNIDHLESRSLAGVSLVKVHFKPGTNANAALSNIANLAMADLRRLPPGTLPPVVLKFDASSLPVCLITLQGQGLNETQLKDLAQFQVRNQVANVKGASVPQPFGGSYRQIQGYVDPVKLEAYQLSLMDVVGAVNDSNLILPAGDGGGQRTIRPAGSRDDWRLGNVRGTDRLSRARGVPGNSPQGSRCGGGFVTGLAPPLPCLCRRNVFCSGMNIRPKHVDIDEHGAAGGY